MEKSATDIYTFKNLREGGYTYVDKTGIILPLVDNSIGSQFFLARRFGLGFSSEQRTVTDSAFEKVETTTCDKGRLPMLRIRRG